MENVYSQLKMLHFREHLDRLEKGRHGAPVHVRLKPINACNHRCRFCCYRSDSLFLGENMKESDMIAPAKLREIVADLGACGVKAVTFSGGGEPLLHPGFAEAVHGLAAQGIKVATLTNGGRLAGDAAKALAQHASWVRVSIDAFDGPSLAQSRQVDEAEFDRIAANIQAFAKIKRPDCELGINYIVTRENALASYDFVARMKELGANHVKVCEVIIATTAPEQNAFHAPHFNAVREQINEAKAKLEDVSFKVIDKFHEFEDKYQKPYHSCPMLGFLNVVAADLTVYTCQDKAYTEAGRLGSIKDQSLRELWASADYARAVEAVDPSAHCRHHCVSHGKNLALTDYLSTDRGHLEFV